jgi:hypothetical protein
MIDRIPGRLRAAADGVAKATQKMAAATARRNREAGHFDGKCRSLMRDETVEWQAADMIEKYETTLRAIANDPAAPAFVRTLAASTLLPETI